MERIKTLETRSLCDSAKNGGCLLYTSEEVEAAIDSMGGGGNGIVLPGAGGGQSLTVTQQAALWPVSYTHLDVYKRQAQR